MSRANAGTNRHRGHLGLGDQVERIVQALKQKGVAFEHYDDLPTPPARATCTSRGN